MLSTTFKRQLDPNIKFPYTHEFIAQIEHELFPFLKVGGNFIYRDRKNFQGQPALRPASGTPTGTCSNSTPNGGCPSRPPSRLTRHHLPGPDRDGLLPEQQRPGELQQDDERPRSRNSATPASS